MSAVDLLPRTTASTPVPAGEDLRAIIDIGSNTVRMVIYGGPPRAPAVLFNEKVTARLGKGVAEDGNLSAKSWATAYAALGRFALLLRMHGVARVQTVATAAVRDAANGPAFLAQVAELGLTPRLLSGEEEAVASAHGVLAAFPGARGIVGDLGGGSLELIDVDGTSCTHGVSLPLGTLRLPGLRAEGATKFARRVQRMLAGAEWAAAPGQTLYLVGGSLRAFARFAMEQQGWPIDDPHGFELSGEAALRTARSLAGGMASTMRELPPIPGVSPSRMASLPEAAALLTVLVRELRPSRIVFSGWGLREGLLAEGLDAAVTAQDPLLAGVRAFVEMQQPGLAALAEGVAAWTARANPALPMGATGEPLRLSATMLALASLRTEPNIRAEQAVQWALRKRWIGLDAPGRAMVAAAVLANSGKTSIPPEMMRLAPLNLLREAQAWGLATRLARRFSGGMAPALAESTLTVVGRDLVLAVRDDMAMLYTDASAKDLKVLAECLGLQPVFQIVAEPHALP